MNHHRAFLIFHVFLFLFTITVFAQTDEYANLDGAGFVDFADFAMLADNWQKSGSDLAGDFDENGTVDIKDLEYFAYYWMTGYECKEFDLHEDCFVNFFDYIVFADAWLSDINDISWDARCDFDESGLVDINDLSNLSYCWLKGSHPLDVFESFKAALLADDVDKAVSYFAEVSRENYHTLLEQLRPYFSQMVSDMGELIFIRFDDDRVVYDLLREEEGQMYGYPVTFIRDDMGQWKIYDF
jgi:hypothetical protein